MSDINVLEPDKGKETGDVAPRTIPFEAYQAEKDKRQALEVKLAEQKGRDAALQEASKPKQHTRAELQQHVDDGRFSQDEADRILNKQTESNIEERVSAKLQAANQESVRSAMVSEEISKYVAAKPGVMTAGSDERNMVETQYQHLLSMGKPEGAETDLDALRTVFGPSSNLQNARSKDPEAHQDVGGDGGDEGDGNSGGKPLKGLSADARKYYEKQIDRGMYPDWEAVNKELEIASPSVKRRLGVG